MRRLVICGALALVALFLASAGQATRADETIVITPLDTGRKLAKQDYNGGPFSLIVTGKMTIEYASGTKVSYDALYCFTCTKRENRSVIDMYVPNNNPIPSTWGGLWDWIKFDGPAYNAAHRYEIGPFNTAETDLFPDIGFEVSRSYKDCRDCKFSGAFSIRVVRGAVKPKDLGKVRVDFSVRVSGKPGLPIRGAAPAPANVRLNARGFAIFPVKPAAKEFVANKTEGSVTLTDGKRTLKLGIHSGSKYYPARGALLLLLKVDESNDTQCPKSSGGSIRAATLGLLPVSGESDLGTAIFLGIPRPKAIVPFVVNVTPCKGHAYGWRGGDGASVRMLIRETKLP